MSTAVLDDPYQLTPGEQQQAEAVIDHAKPNPVAVAAGLGGAFLVYRQFMKSRLKSQINSYSENTAEADLGRNLDEVFAGFVPSWMQMVVPLVFSGFLSGQRQSGVLMDTGLLGDVAVNYSWELGYYLHQKSVEAVLTGYAAQVNRKVPWKVALGNVLDSFGVTKRHTKTLTNIWTGTDPVSNTETLKPSQKKKRAEKLVAAAIDDRAKTVGDQEAWSMKEQGKQLAWSWAVNKGIIPATATRVWETAKDEKVCPQCGPLHRMEVNISDKFPLDKGKIWAPPVHVNCRCSVKIKLNLIQHLGQQAAQEAQEMLSKAYEGRPWVRYQQRNELGEWVAEGAARAAEPTQEAEKRPTQPPPPPPKVASQTPAIDFGGSGIHFGRSKTPALDFGSAPPQLDFGPAKQEQTLEVPALDFGTAPKEQTGTKFVVLPKLDFGTAPKTEVKEEAKPKIEVEEIPISAEELAHEEELEYDARKRAGIFTNAYKLEKPIYGIVDADNLLAGDNQAFLHQVYFTSDVESLREDVNTHMLGSVEGYIDNKFGDNEEIKAFSQGGMQFYVDKPVVEEAFEWLMAKQAHDIERAHGDEYETIYDRNHEVELNVRDTDGSWGVYDVPVKKLIREMHLDEEFEAMAPVIVRADELDLDKSTMMLPESRGPEAQAAEITGMHNIEGRDEMLSDFDGMIPYHVFRVSPEYD